MKKTKLKLKNIRWDWLAAGAIVGAALAASCMLIYGAIVPARHSNIVSGDHIKTDMYEITVGNLTTVDFDRAFTTVKENDLVIIPVRFTNRSKDTVQFFPVLSTYIRDTTGGTWTMHPALAIKKPFPAQEVAPGETISGELSYEVPKTLKEFKYHIDPGWKDMAPVVFSLKR